MNASQFFIGLFIATALIIISNSDMKSGSECEHDIVYFDKRFNCPKTRNISTTLVENALNDSSFESLNDQPTKYARNPYIRKTTNLAASRWKGSSSSQPNTNDGHVSFTNTDISTNPMQLQHALKNKDDATRNATGLVQLGRVSQIEKFTARDQSGVYSQYKTGMQFQKDEVADINSQMNFLSDNLLT